VQSEETLRDMADRSVSYGSATIGGFKLLGKEDNYLIYKLANH